MEPRPCVGSLVGDAHPYVLAIVAIDIDASQACRRSEIGSREEIECGGDAQCSRSDHYYRQAPCMMPPIVCG
jgi:hypothetical protein